MGRRRSAGGPLGIVIPLAFSVLVMGSSIPLALLPLYREMLALSPEEVSRIFSAFLGAMVIMLAIGSMPVIHARPRITLAIALIVIIVADGFFIIATDWSLLVARLLTGVSSGVGLGAAAKLALIVLDE